MGEGQALVGRPPASALEPARRSKQARAHRGASAGMQRASAAAAAAEPGKACAAMLACGQQHQQPPTRHAPPAIPWQSGMRGPSGRASCPSCRCCSTDRAGGGRPLAGRLAALHSMGALNCSLKIQPTMEGLPSPPELSPCRPAINTSGQFPMGRDSNAIYDR